MYLSTLPYCIEVSLFFLAYLFPLLGQYALGEFGLKCTTHVIKGFSIIKKKVFKKKMTILTGR